MYLFQFPGFVIVLIFVLYDLEIAIFMGKKMNTGNFLLTRWGFFFLKENEDRKINV